MSTQAENAETTLFGHPSGLFVLFFAEMWERFSYYGMRALLVYYMIKGFLQYSDNEAYAVYGAYGALVYATPFIGGMIADRVLGARKAVLLGGILMAAGHLLMTIENKTFFFLALALLICGNGFFKPNISTIVGTLYPDLSNKRDSGFTLFYMGINLGAAMSPLLCGYIGETYGWHYGFGLATIGMLVGLAVFWAPLRITQALIASGAVITAVGLFAFSNSAVMTAVNGLVAIALLIAAGVSFTALNKGGLPEGAGAPPDAAKLARPLLGPINAEWTIYLGVALVVPFVALLVQRNALAGVVLSIFGVAALFVILGAAFKSTRIERDRLVVVLILMFFSMLFWSFFEQAGSSINNFTDRNVNRYAQVGDVDASEVGQSIEIPVSQDMVGRIWTGPALSTLMPEQEDPDAYLIDGKLTLSGLDKIRDHQRAQDLEAGRAPSDVVVNWAVADEHVGMGTGGSEIKASVFQAANPIYILLFGLGFSWLWGFLGKRNLDPPTPVKFGLGLLQLGLGFAVLWYGAQNADERGMVNVAWLLLGYLLHTTGELCLSPVGLSMVTKLSPKNLVSTVMGAWFLATAFSGFLAGIIAQLTGVSHGGDGAQIVPLPTETVGVYGDVFGQIAVATMISAGAMFALAPLLTRWMHEGEVVAQPDSDEVDPDAPTISDELVAEE